MISAKEAGQKTRDSMFEKMPHEHRIKAALAIVEAKIHEAIVRAESTIWISTKDIDPTVLDDVRTTLAEQNYELGVISTENGKEILVSWQRYFWS